MAAGSVVVDLLMRTGSFETDTQRASKSLKQFKKDADAAGKALGVAFTAGAVGLVALVKSTIDSEDHLADLSKKTGIAVDTLGGIGFAAAQAGGDLDSASAAAGKLNKSLAEAAAGNDKALEAFNALGISVKDIAGNTKTADVVLAEIATKFAGYADGPEKAALALRLFGKAGADIIPLLDEGGASLLANIAYFKRYSGVTAETAKAADEFNDTQTKLKLLSQAFGSTLAADLLPTLQTLADRFLAAKEQGSGFHDVAEGIVTIFKGLVIAGAYVIDTFGGVGREIGAIAAQVVALSHLDFKAFTAIGDAVKADGVQAKKNLDAFVEGVLNPSVAKLQAGFSDARFDARNKPKGSPPRLPGGNTAGADTAAQELKKRLDGQLRLIQDFERNQADAYAVGESYLQGVYSDGLVSQKEYFSDLKNLRDANLANALEAIDKEIAAQRAFIANPQSKPVDRTAAEEKIKLAVQQRSEAITKASAADILAVQSEGAATRQLADQYANLRSQVLSLSGDEFGAAQIKNAQQVKAARDLITQAGGDPAQADRLKQLLGFQAQASQLQKDYSKLLDETARREEEIYLDAQKAGVGELDTLAAVRDARKLAIDQLQQQAQAAANLAAQSGLDSDIKRAADLAVALKKASAEIDPLAAKFNGILEDSFSSAFDSFVTGSRNATQAFRDFGKSVLLEIERIAAKDLAKSLFGDTGGSSGIGGFLSSLFKGSSGNPQGIGDKYNGSGNSAGLISSIASLFSGFFAEGGYIPPGQWGIAGERGPEPVFGGRSGATVQPAGASVSRTTVQHITIAPPAGMSRQASLQFAADAARQIAIANRRNN